MLLGTALVLAPPATVAGASVPHVVQPGETLWSVSAANNLTTATAAAPAEPVAAEPATSAPAVEPIAPAPGMGHIDSPWGPLHLDPAAAESWNAMADAAMQQFGVDLHPGGTVSAYRTYEQQASLYQ